jgi:hypothetical protein
VGALLLLGGCAPGVTPTPIVAVLVETAIVVETVEVTSPSPLEITPAPADIRSDETAIQYSGKDDIQGARDFTITPRPPNTYITSFGGRSGGDGSGIYWYEIEYMPNPPRISNADMGNYLVDEMSRYGWTLTDATDDVFNLRFNFKPSTEGAFGQVQKAIIEIGHNSGRVRIELYTNISAIDWNKYLIVCCIPPL